MLIAIGARLGGDRLDQRAPSPTGAAAALALRRGLGVGAAQSSAAWRRRALRVARASRPRRRQVLPVSTTPYCSRAASDETNSSSTSQRTRLRVALQRIAPAAAAAGAHDDLGVAPAPAGALPSHHAELALPRLRRVAAAVAGLAAPHAPGRAALAVGALEIPAALDEVAHLRCRCRARRGTCPAPPESRRSARLFTSTGHFSSMPSIEPLRTSPWQTETVPIRRPRTGARPSRRPRCSARRSAGSVFGIAAEEHDRAAQEPVMRGRNALRHRARQAP